MIFLLPRISPSLNRIKYQARISKAKKKAGYRPRSLAQAIAEAEAEEETDSELEEYELEMEEKTLSMNDRIDRMAGYLCFRAWHSW